MNYDLSELNTIGFELLESYINGNQSYVRGELNKLTPLQVVYVMGLMFDENATEAQKLVNHCARIIDQGEN